VFRHKFFFSAREKRETIKHNKFVGHRGLTSPNMKNRIRGPGQVARCAAHLLIYIIWFFGYKFQMKITINNISRAFMPQTEASEVGRYSW